MHNVIGVDGNVAKDLANFPASHPRVLVVGDTPHGIL